MANLARRDAKLFRVVLFLLYAELSPKKMVFMKDFMKCQYHWGSTPLNKAMVFNSRFATPWFAVLKFQGRRKCAFITFHCH